MAPPEEAPVVPSPLGASKRQRAEPADATKPKKRPKEEMVEVDSEEEREAERARVDKEREEREMIEREKEEAFIRRAIAMIEAREASRKYISDSLSESESAKENKLAGRVLQTDEELRVGMYKALEAVKAHEEAWPFLDPVEEEYAPNYYAVIRRPMDLNKLESRLDAGVYQTREQFEADFKLIVDNCKLYNGLENEYTEMVVNIEREFRKAVHKYLDIEEDEDDIFIDVSQVQPKQRRASPRPATAGPGKKRGRKPKKKQAMFIDYSDDELLSSPRSKPPTAEDAERLFEDLLKTAAMHQGKRDRSKQRAPAAEQERPPGKSKEKGSKRSRSQSKDKKESKRKKRKTHGKEKKGHTVPEEVDSVEKEEEAISPNAADAGHAGQPGCRAQSRKPKSKPESKPRTSLRQKNAALKDAAEQKQAKPKPLFNSRSISKEESAKLGQLISRVRESRGGGTTLLSNGPGLTMGKVLGGAVERDKSGAEIWEEMVKAREAQRLESEKRRLESASSQSPAQPDAKSPFYQTSSESEKYQKSPAFSPKQPPSAGFDTAKYNGGVKPGFYQDMTQKTASPDKSPYRRPGSVASTHSPASVAGSPAYQPNSPQLLQRQKGQQLEHQVRLIQEQKQKQQRCSWDANSVSYFKQMASPHMQLYHQQQQTMKAFQQQQQHSSASGLNLGGLGGLVAGAGYNPLGLASSFQAHSLGGSTYPYLLGQSRSPQPAHQNFSQTHASLSQMSGQARGAAGSPHSSQALPLTSDPMYQQYYRQQEELLLHHQAGAAMMGPDGPPPPAAYPPGYPHLPSLRQAPAGSAAYNYL
ncbi:bromodomain-containing protein 3-like [Pollicipes pollicipes]|uniref:bromodomain-containing protein 3-like n=1 Tax=Pollicipes pollicipes TaxID=41117 RepID=UPI001884E554|nr:bromodomain-containing protein 3-like [Pollicipes pollicipes]